MTWIAVTAPDLGKPVATPIDTGEMCDRLRLQLIWLNEQHTLPFGQASKFRRVLNVQIDAKAEFSFRALL